MKNSVHDWNDSNKFEDQEQKTDQTEHIIDHDKDDTSLVYLWDLLRCCLKLRKINLMHQNISDKFIMDLSEQFAKEKDSYEDLIYLGINQNQ
jgi:hypothetical protein